MAKLRNVVYLTKAQKDILFTPGGTVGGISYDANDLYIVLQLWDVDGSASDYLYIKDFTGTERVRVSNNGMVRAAGFEGSGALLTNLSASSITSGTIDMARLPAIAITDRFVYNTPTDFQTAYSANHDLLQKGDVVIFTTNKETYIHNGGTAWSMDDLTKLETPTDLVSSVNGKAGVVVIGPTDITWTSSYRTVTDSEKNTWNNKSDAHTHPYRSSSWVPSWGEVTGKIGSTYGTTAGTFAEGNHIHTIGYYSTAASSDLNTTLGTGQFSWYSGSTNTPVASSFGQGINIVSAGTAHNNLNNWITQLAFSTENNKAYFRGKTNGGSWGTWHTFYHTGNKPTASDITGLDNTHRWLTDAHISTWNAKEPAIGTKNTAFNKNYGTTVTDVKMNGTQSVGSIDAIARIDHVHPTDTSRAADNTVVKLTGNQTIAGVKTFSANIKTTTISNNYVAENVHRFSTTGTPVQTVIYTGIKYLSSTHMPVVRIYGYAYGLTSPIELKIGFYIYGGNLGWAGVVSMGAWKPQVYLFKYNFDGVDYVAIGLSGSCYFLAFQVDVQSVNFTGNIDSSILTTGWFSASRSQAEVDAFNTIIPSVGIDNCVSVAYKSTLDPLTLQFNGVTNQVFDGASPKTLNITPASIGASATNHMHAYRADTWVPSWSDVTGKIGSAYGTAAGTFAEGNHTHDDRYYTEGEVNSKIFLKSDTDNRNINTVPNDYNSKFEIKGLKTNSVIGINDGGAYSALLGIRGWTDSSGGPSHELAFDSSGRINHRQGNTTAWSAWTTLIESNDPRLTNSRPASDVYGWAKAASKPSYSWSEIGSKPSFATVATSGSYADLSNKPTIPTIPSVMSTTEGNTGTDTTQRTISALNLKSIILNHSPAGARSASDVYTWAKQSVKPIYNFSEIGNTPTTLSGYGITDGMTATAINSAISTAISNLVASSPATLDTLNELAAALGNDPAFATTMTNLIGTKVTANTAITGATKTKITYDSKGLVTGGADLSASDIPPLAYVPTSKFLTTDVSNGINPNNVVINTLGYANNLSLLGQTDGAIYAGVHSSSWVHEIYGDFRTGQIAVRGKENGTWRPWRIVRDTINFVSGIDFAPPHSHPYRPDDWVPSASQITGLDDTHRWLTDALISTWNAKSDAHTHPYLSDSHDAKDVTATLIGRWNTAYTHAGNPHAPSNAQKNSDITKAEIEAKLTGAITSHTHYYAGSSTPGGVATAAAVSTYIGVSDDTANSDKYVGFFDSNSGNRAPKVGSLTYNPSIKKLGGVEQLVSPSGGLTLGDTGPYTFIRLCATEQDAVLFDDGNSETTIIDFNGVYVGPVNMNNQRSSINAFTLAANTESSAYYISGYKYAMIHLFSSSDSYTMMVWETRIDLTDPNQYTYNATRYRRIYWNTGSSSASGNFYSNDTLFVIGTGTSGYVKFKHNGGAGFRYKITLEK